MVALRSRAVGLLRRKTKSIPFSIVDFSQLTNCPLPFIWAVIVVYSCFWAVTGRSWSMWAEPAPTATRFRSHSTRTSSSRYGRSSFDSSIRFTF